MAAIPVPPFGFPPNMALLPLPPGWTQHTGPTGQPYYYNSMTRESTYIRPLPMFPLPPLAPIPAPAPVAANPQENKKEKPLYKIPIPNTPWLRVKTTHGNVFFTQTERKESVWTVPEEIKEFVEEMDWDKMEEEAAREKEMARLAKELERDASLKRKADPASAQGDSTTAPADSEAPPPKKRKRKPVAVVEPLADQAIDEIVVESTNDGAEPAEGDDDIQVNEEEDQEDEEDDEDAFSDSEAEEAWQREMAEGMAKLAQEESSGARASGDANAEEDSDGQDKKLKGEDNDANDKSKEKVTSKNFAVPAQVNLSTEESRALFKTLLTEKNPSTLAPFSSVMPLLITDPRYVLLPSQAEREAAFNEWCKEAVRLKRLNAKSSAPATSAAPASASTAPATAAAELNTNATPPIDHHDEKAAARTGYDALLSTEVTSTRTTWDEFKRKWKKDRRFFGFGRDDREREKVFRGWVRDLGERKRAQAKKTELEFMELLKSNASTIPITANSQWKDVKRPLVKDPRYDAVGSSTLREELFGTFLKALASGSLASIATSTSTPDPSASKSSHTTNKSNDDPSTTSRQDRQKAALASRTQAAQSHLSKLSREIEASKGALQSSEAEEALLSFYTDVVRDLGVGWDELVRMFGKGARAGGSSTRDAGARGGESAGAREREREEGEEELDDVKPMVGGEDPRFSECPLPEARKRALFSGHMTRLREKYRTQLEGLYLAAVMPRAAPTSSLAAEARGEGGARAKEAAGKGMGIGLEKTWGDLDEGVRRGLERSLPAVKLGLNSSTSSSSLDDRRDRSRSRSPDRRRRRDREGRERPSHPHVVQSPLEIDFTSWQDRRTAQARADFQALLQENSFIEFWGKVGKSSNTKRRQHRAGADGEDGEEDEGEDEDEMEKAGKRGFAVTMGEEDLGMDLDAEGDVGGGAGAGGDGEDDGLGGKDLKTLAKSIGVEEVERVLKNDQRYRAFDHIPEERRRWVQAYLSSLSAAKLSVHVPQ